MRVSKVIMLLFLIKLYCSLHYHFGIVFTLRRLFFTRCKVQLGTALVAEVFMLDIVVFAFGI